MTTSPPTAAPNKVDPLKIVNIILPASNTKTSENSTNTTATATESGTRASSINTSSSSSTTSASNSPGCVPPRTPKSDDVLFAEPTFSEKFFRYLVVVIYLGGLSSLGFILSIYYLFFWDSRMPPVFKPTKKPPVFIKP